PLWGRCRQAERVFIANTPVLERKGLGGRASRCSLPLFRQDADGALVGAGREGGVGLQRRRDVALARGGRLPAELVLLGAAGGELFLGDRKVDRAVRDIDLDEVALAHEADGAALGGFRRGMADG